jgi:hypothetical protein
MSTIKEGARVAEGDWSPQPGAKNTKPEEKKTLRAQPSKRKEQ